jgi:uncharacterized lipoprotein
MMSRSGFGRAGLLVALLVAGLLAGCDAASQGKQTHDQPNQLTPTQPLTAPETRPSVGR